MRHRLSLILGVLLHKREEQVMGADDKNVSTLLKRSPGLDLARTLGVSGVVAAHATAFIGLLGISDEVLLPLHVWGGMLGVELFFALSGLLVGEILFRDVLTQPSVRSLGLFLGRRWMRTLPAYYAVLAALVVLALWQEQRIPNLWLYITFLQNSAPEYASFFGVSWSLSVEQWSYIFIPLLLVAILWLGSFCNLKIQNKTLWLYIIVATLIIYALVRLYIALDAPALWGYTFRSQVPLRLDAVLFGVLLAWVKLFRPTLFAKLGSWVVFAGCIIGLTVLNSLYNPSLQKPEGNIFLKSFGFSFADGLCALSLCFLDKSLVVRRVFAPDRVIGRLALWGSRYSYSVYLVHYTVFMLVLSTFGLTAASSAPKVLFGLFTALVVTFTLSVALYHYVEKPFMDLRKYLALRKSSTNSNTPEPCEIQEVILDTGTSAERISENKIN